LGTPCSQMTYFMYISTIFVSLCVVFIGIKCVVLVNLSTTIVMESCCFIVMGILEIKYSVNNSHFHYEMVNGCNNPTGVYAWFHHLLSSFWAKHIISSQLQWISDILGVQHMESCAFFLSTILFSSWEFNTYTLPRYMRTPSSLNLKYLNFYCNSPCCNAPLIFK
jgi:hypothetical protein